MNAQQMTKKESNNFYKERMQLTEQFRQQEHESYYHELPD